jgi:arabinan endo-1,5-alpha-L-arabinosidase
MSRERNAMTVALLRTAPARLDARLALQKLLAVITVSAGLAGVGQALAAPAQYSKEYSNPILPLNAADPAVIHGLDGYYYLYATSTQFGGTGSEHIFPIWRSTDLVHWSYVKDAFTAPPDWAGPATALWAPDVHYLDGKYYLYYTADQANALPAYHSPAGVPAIGVATAPTPLGPWKDAGPPAGGSYRTGPLIAPSWGFCTDPTSASCYNWEYDSYVYQGPDAKLWLYEGSYFGGNRVHQLTADGLNVVPKTDVQFGHNIRTEASYLLPHLVNGTLFYYMLNSQSDCCTGPNSPYSVIANRSTTPNGPFSDQNNAPMEWFYGPFDQLAPGSSPFSNPIWYDLADEAGGFPLLRQNGNGVVGAGGQAIVKDLAGQDWLFYHGIEQDQPWITGGRSSTANVLRQLYLDPLQWTAAGWPEVNSGSGPSRHNAAPVTTPEIGDNFNDSGQGAPDYPYGVRAIWLPFAGDWQPRSEPQAGGFIRQASASRLSVLVSGNRIASPDRGYYASCDLRAQGSSGQYGCLTSIHPEAPLRLSFLSAAIDVSARSLTLGTYRNNVVVGTLASAALPSGLDVTQWHHLTVAVTPGGSGAFTATAQLQTLNGDVLAVTSLPGVSAETIAGSGSIALATNGMSADFDNVSLAPAANDTAQGSPPPQPGALIAALSDDFGGAIGPQWRVLRPDGSLRGFSRTGSLSLTTNGTLDEYQRLNANAANPPDLPPTKNLVLEATPGGNYVVETRMHFDPQNANQEAGLAIYSDDDTNVQNDITWNGTVTMVASLRNELSRLPSGVACPLRGPMSGASVATLQYGSAACPPTSEHTSQEYPANLTCCFVGNGQGPGGGYLGGNLDPSRITVWLRVYRNGNIYTPWFSLDGKTWSRENAWTLNPSGAGFPMRIGLFAQDNQNIANPGANAWFDYVHVYQVP